MEVIIRAAPISEVRKRLVRSGAALPAAAKAAADVFTQAAAEAPAVAVTPAPVPVAPERSEEEKARAAERELRLRLQMEQEATAAKAEAAQRGYSEGLAKGAEAAKAAVGGQLERLATVIASLHQARRGVIEDATDTTVEVVYAAVCRILGTAAVQREGVVGMVKQAVASFQHSGELTVALHPHDLALIHEMAQGFGVQDVDKQLRLRADDAIVGGCVVEGSSGTLDARLDTQLTRLQETLLAVRKNRAEEGEHH